MTSQVSSVSTTAAIVILLSLREPFRLESPNFKYYLTNVVKIGWTHGRFQQFFTYDLWFNGMPSDMLVGFCDINDWSYDGTMICYPSFLLCA